MVGIPTVYSEIDGFSSVWRLCKTSRQLDRIFADNPGPILRLVALRCLEALKLAIAEELGADHRQTPSAHPATHQNRAHRMQLSASAAVRAISHYEASVFHHTEQEGQEHLSRNQLTATEKMAFVRAYYHALLKILASLGQPKIPVNPLWQLNMPEYTQIREVTMLLTPVRKWKDSINLGIRFPHICSPDNECKKGSNSPFASVSLPLPIDGPHIPLV